MPINLYETLNEVKFAYETVDSYVEVLILRIKSLLIVKGHSATLLLHWLNNNSKKNT